MLLFQLDTVEQGNFELMFGDCGHIYFYITKEHLAARRFDRIWLIDVYKRQRQQSPVLLR